MAKQAKGSLSLVRNVIGRCRPKLAMLNILNAWAQVGERDAKACGVASLQVFDGSRSGIESPMWRALRDDLGMDFQKKFRDGSEIAA
jgi:hypothetical protein